MKETMQETRTKMAVVVAFPMPMSHEKHFNVNSQHSIIGKFYVARYLAVTVPAFDFWHEFGR